MTNGGCAFEAVGIASLFPVIRLSGSRPWIKHRRSPICGPDIPIVTLGDFDESVGWMGSSQRCRFLAGRRVSRPRFGPIPAKGLARNAQECTTSRGGDIELVEAPMAAGFKFGLSTLEGSKILGSRYP